MPSQIHHACFHHNLNKRSNITSVGLKIGSLATPQRQLASFEIPLIFVNRVVHLCHMCELSGFFVLKKKA
ncbi:hypothetical protein BpHYR1_023088 [Brachionus plicatilis]|uniref:Uncharacterized protein n=1 Tax=Brachionus plicatilis TaxID=10195 RepID=A0A3M7P3D6_BRAPC|nr:hypothetical protein BpHYR1_023088 [Brachionus plicatilis]